MKKFITSFSIVALLLILSVGVVSAASPSTNDTNRTNNWAHVDQLSQGVGTTDLKFISTGAFASCFEYRTDGDTSQILSANGGNNYNTLITDGLYPYYCQNNNNSTHTINANGYVEVRMVFGAESDERFDWTRFNVLPPVDVCSNIEGNQAEVPTDYYATEGDCYAKTPVCNNDSYKNYGGEDGEFNPETEVANNELCANEPTPTPEVTPAPQVNTGGPGDGMSDGRSDGLSSCPSCTQAPKTQGQVLGASTGPQVLGLSTTSGEENALPQLIQILGALTSAGLGFVFLKKNG